MKKAIKRSFALLTFVLISAYSYSQFKLGAEVRPRAEYRHGFKALPSPDQKSAFFVDQRTRLNFDYALDRIQFKIVLQDVRAWGSQSQLVGNEDFGTSVHEAWGIAKLNSKIGIKFGRQELVYDDHRIFGNVGWAQQARSHDAMVFQIRPGKKFKLDIGAAYNQNAAGLIGTNYTVGKSYKTMQYAWGNFAASEQLKISFLALSLGQQVDYTNSAGNPDYQDNYTLTAGTRIVYKKEKIGASLNAYYQLGSTNTWPANSVSAYNFCLDVFYKIAKPLKLSVGFEMLSGQSQTDTTSSYLSTNHAFNPYFGTNHKFNGLMDYFFVGNHIGSVGLNDIYLRLDYKHKKFNLGLTGHALLANTDILDAAWLASSGEIRALSPYMGMELDFFGGFNLAPGAALKFGYSQMLGTTSMEAIKGGDSGEIANWGWAMVIFKPTLFDQSAKKK